ncbi:MAG TPA: hypothetical protein VF614_03315 [Chthoniobacteraceae bacterium]|jgi:hypothetical protein
MSIDLYSREDAKGESVAELLAKFFGAICAIALLSLWRGYVLSILWGWFIVTTFGAKPLGIAEALGLLCVVSFLTAQYQPTLKSDQSESGKLLRVISFGFTLPAIALAIGAVVRCWL